MNPYISIIRPHQWYKNLLIFIGIIFSAEIQNLNLYPSLILGFISLCLISGVNYIINDIVDVEKDKIHPNNRNRPLVTGQISIYSALIYFVILSIISILIASNININFFYILFLIFITSQIYTFWAKKIIFVDVIFISILFVFRALSGIYIININYSGWVILCTFFLAMFLALCKRKGDLSSLGINASKHRGVFKEYTNDILTELIRINCAILIMSYSIYAIFVIPSHLMMITIPIAVFLVFRYLYLAQLNDFAIGKRPEQVFKDKQFLRGIFIWIVMIIYVLYQ